ncbi:hypothetical protein H6761_01960 [Candidatus Nomurabacteria bacterium]|nr:hypothetical protein [Candidatus Nomurabacteria bacterium]
MKNIKAKLQMPFNLLHSFKKICLFSLVFLWLGYLVSINHAATQSFELDDLNQGIKDLNQQILLLNVKATGLQSIERIENASKNLDLVKTDNIYYLASHEQAVALR